jgi:hypothetical protein
VGRGGGAGLAGAGGSACLVRGVLGCWHDCKSGCWQGGAVSKRDSLTPTHAVDLHPAQNSPVPPYIIFGLGHVLYHWECEGMSPYLTESVIPSVGTLPK